MHARGLIFSALLLGAGGCPAAASTSSTGGNMPQIPVDGADAGSTDNRDASSSPVLPGFDATLPARPDVDTGIANKCGELTVPTSAEVIPGQGNVLIVFDQSNSMTTNFSGKPLWQAASDAVRDALTPHKDSLTVGAIFFPTASLGTGILCTPDNVADMGMPPQISFQDGTSFLQAWAQRFASAGLVFGTPTSVAMEKGDAALKAAQLMGPTVVLLVTDGASTCFLSDTSTDTATQLRARGISTYVIGLPGAGAAESALNAIAAAGGTNKYFTPGDSTALTTELGRIFGTIVKPTLKSCDINFEQLPDDLDQVALVVTDTETGGRFRVLPGADGWELSTDKQSATLLGSTCDSAIAGKFSDVSFEFGCEEIPVL